MFAMRNLDVRTWSGVNLLGGGDGANLVDPGANAAKSVSKQRVLRETLGYAPQGDTRIDYVADIGDFKTSWDLVTFAGFLGTGMCLQFTWQGCDSALAAPLVLDLARITLAAHEAGRGGPLEQLAYFFKDPMGDVDHALHAQWETLRTFVAGLGAEAGCRMAGGDRAARPRGAGPRAGRPVGSRRRRRGSRGGRRAGSQDRRAVRVRGVPVLGGHGGQRLGRPRTGRRGAPRAADTVRPRLAGRRPGRRRGPERGGPGPGGPGRSGRSGRSRWRYR